jgi:peptide deformylase
MGHPVLRQKGRELKPDEILSPELMRLVEDMVETMREYGGIGLAAPQIHESLQLAILDLSSAGDRYPDAGNEQEQPLLVVINPKITVLDDKEQGFWEGCLSVPEIRGLVYRPRKVQIDFVDLNAKPRQVTAEGFLATVFQHELDHLAGVLFVDRLKSEPGKTPIAFLEEYQRYLVPQEDSDVGELED